MFCHHEVLFDNCELVTDMNMPFLPCWYSKPSILCKFKSSLTQCLCLCQDFVALHSMLNISEGLHMSKFSWGKVEKNSSTIGPLVESNLCLFISCNRLLTNDRAS